MLATASSNDCSWKSPTQTAGLAEVSSLVCCAETDGGRPRSEFDVLQPGERGRGECMPNWTSSSWGVIGFGVCVSGIGAEMKDVIKKPGLDMSWG